MKYIYTVLLLCLMMLSSCSSLKTNNNWIAGKWSGLGFQPGMEVNYFWDIEAYLDTKQQVFKISYPSLNCSGDWVLIHMNQHKAIFKEINITNIEACTNNGTVILTKVDERHISFSYYIENNNQVASYATLSRK